jgi:PAS domain S-box-containing protein
MDKGKNSFIQNLTISYECALAIGNSLELEEMLYEVIHKIVHKTNAHRGSIWLRAEKEGQSPILGARAGLRLTDAENKKTADSLCKIFNKIWVKQKIVIKYRDDKDFSKYCHIITGKEQSVLIVPLSNTAMFHLVYSNREIVNETLGNILAGFSQKLINAIKACIAHKSIIKEIQVREKTEDELKKKTGQLIYSQKELQRLYFESEKSRKSLLSILEDVVEKEKALRISEERFQDIVNTTGDWIWEINKEGRYTYSSPVVEQVLGYTPDEILGKYFYDFISPDQKDNLKKSFFKITTDKKMPIKNFINTNIHKNGSQVILETNIIPIKDDNDQFMGYRGVDRDITQRKYAEEALRIKDNAIASSINAITICDLDGKPNYVNNSFLEMWGYKDQGKVIGKPFVIFWQTENHAVKLIDKLYKKGKWMGRLTAKKKDGSLFDVQVSASIVYDESGKPDCLMASFLDITDQQRLEDQFRQAQKMEAVGRLAGGIAHDFNNLLTVILGYSELALTKLDENDPLYKNLEQITNAGRRAEGLTRQLLAFSRRQLIQLKVLDINDIIEDMKKMLRRLIEEDIKLIMMLDPEAAHIKADPGQIEQVIMNLVVNARDVMPGGGKLTIETKNAYFDESNTPRNMEIEYGSYVLLKISDTGIGMDEETMSHIFEPFFTTKKVGEGTGLGLSTVYGIVKQNKGEICVQSVLGIGTTFEIYLPGVKDIPQVDKDKAVKKDEWLKGTETILVVEDDDLVRDLACQVLRQQDYQILEASQGGDALLICEQYEKPIHLILTDIVMPIIRGHELVERLKQIKPEMKSLFMSGYTDDDVVKNKLQEDDLNFIKKPFTPQDLLLKVREILDSPL